MRHPVLIVRQPWAGLLLSGEKTVELRGAPAHKHVGKRIFVSISGPGGAETVVGYLTMTQCEGPLTQAAFEALAPNHLLTMPIGGSAPAHASGALPYKRTFAYHMRDPVVLPQALPCPRRHCVTWATFEGPDGESA